MLFHYESEKLNYDIYAPENADRILDFYYANKAVFEPYEPDHPDSFYTPDYQTTLAKLEYENFLRTKSARYWISLKDRPANLIGCVSFNNIVRGSFMNCTIGYKIHKCYQKMGYATEAVNFLCTKAYEELGLHRIEAYIEPSNTSSIALAQKCGFEYDGIAKEYVYMKGQWRDHLRFTRIAPGSIHHP